MDVPLFASRASLEPLLDEIADRQRAVLHDGRYILGPEVEAFESEFAAQVGAEHCIGVANGTDALAIALRALGVGPGDEVVVPSLSFFATVEPVVTIGATPVFCDVDPDTWVMTAETAEPAITDRTRALLPVHIFGNPAPVGDLLELAGPRPEARWITLHAGRDDFHASIPLDQVRERAIIIYRHEGQPLPAAAGGPFRFYIRDYLACHSADIDECANVKFVDRIELSTERGHDNRPHDDEAHARLHGPT